MNWHAQTVQQKQLNDKHIVKLTTEYNYWIPNYVCTKLLCTVYCSSYKHNFTTYNK